MQTIVYILPELFLSLAIMFLLMLGVFIKKSFKLVNLLTIFFGIYPEPLFNTIDISVSNLIDNYQTDLNFYLMQKNN